MSTLTEHLAHGKNNEIWTKYCGFLDLSLEEYMKIQERLLMEQIELLAKCEMGRVLFGDHIPRDIDEFRENVPLTNYETYAPYLLEKREDVLPPGEYRWAYTSGRTSLDGFKWVPIPQKMYEHLGEATISGMLLSSCAYKGDVTLTEGNKILVATAPPPFISGFLSYSTQEQMPVQFLPPLDEGEKMAFEERTNHGFEMAKEMGLDYFFGLSSLLAKIGAMFEQGAGNRSKRKYLKSKILFRMLRGMLRAKICRRNLYPKDVWRLKGIITTGTDTTIYRDRVEKYWGKKPLEGYICTEGGALATQAWTFYGLNFYPDSNFLEFIPYEDHLKNKLDRNYKPRTLLLNEIHEGIYELVFTNLLGGVFTRYRIGDLFEVIALKDKEAGINLPQFKLYARTDSLIDLGGIARVTEMQIAQAIEHTKLNHKDWVARKEEKNGEVMLHIYLELKEQTSISDGELKMRMRAALLENVPEFPDLESLLGNNHFQVTLLPTGTWDYYKDFQKRMGADITQLKPPHIHPSDATMKILLGAGERK